MIEDNEVESLDVDVEGSSIADSVLEDDQRLLGGTFNKKFKNCISEIESPEAGNIKVLDISPETPPKGVIFLAPGWLETLQGNKYLVYQMVVNGYRVISLEHPRGGGTQRSSEERRRVVINTVLSNVDVDTNKMTVVAHSLGAIDMIKLANQDNNDNRFGHFILVNPAGLEDENRSGVAKLLGLGKHYLAHMKAPASRNPVSEAVRKKIGTIGMKDLVKSPGLALREGLQVALTDIKPDLAELRKKGHKVVVFAQEDDKLFPPNGDGILGHVDHHVVLHGDHNTFRTLDPSDADQQIFGRWIDFTIDYFNKDLN